MKELYASCILNLEKLKQVFLFISLSLFLGNGLFAQQSISAFGYTYAESFNNFDGNTATEFGTGGLLFPEWSVSFASTALYRGQGDGAGNAGGVWSYGVNSDGDRSLGALRSNGPTGSGNITYTITFINNTGAVINSLKLAWDYEQWRYSNTSGFNCTGTGSLAGNVTIENLDFNGTATGTNGNVSLTPISLFTLTGLNIANGSSFGISWVTTDVLNADNGISIDNFSLEVPTPCSNPTIGSGPTPSTQQACLNLTPTNISISATGTTPTYQWYSNTVNSNSGGTSVGAANGGQTNTYTPPTTVAGTTYYYCVVTACSQSVTSSTSTVTVNTPLAATISYPNTPFCSNAGTQTVIRTGASGGGYSSAAGLSINAGTGDINPATSTAGTYTVTYSLAATGGCPIQTTTTSVTVTALPAATISYAAASFCKTAGAQTVTRTGTAGGTYISSPTGLTINSSTGTITPTSSTEGFYTVTYTMAAPGFGCTVNQTTTTTVSIKSTSTVVSPAVTQDLSPGVDGTTLTVSEGDVPLSRQWKYGFTAGGPYTINLGTATTQTPNFALTGTYYIVCETTYPASPCGGGTIRSNEVQINVTNNSITTTPATYGPFCNNVNNPVTVNFTYSPAINFITGITVFTAQLSDGNGSFASPLNIGTVTSDASGAQTISATIPSGIAGGTGFRIRVVSANPNSTGTNTGTDFTIGGFPSATISYAGSPFCSTTAPQSVTLTGTMGGTFSSTAGLIIDAVSGVITPSTSTPGTYIVTYTMAAVGTCPAQSTTTSVTVTALPSATITYTTSPFCSNSGVQTVTRTGAVGGAFSSTAGLSINSGTGTITPTLSTPGTYNVTYTMAAAGGCPAQTTATSLTITQAPTATISYAGVPFCSNDFTNKPVTRTGAAGGTYTASPAGLSINASTGEISIFSSTPGTYTVTYSMASVGGCPTQTTTTSVTINTAPVVADVIISPSTTITLPGGATATCTTPGGTWSSSNTSVATITAGGAITGVANGTAVIRYAVTSGGCTTISSSGLNVLSSGGVTLWSNPITFSNPSSFNPFTNGQSVNSNLSVSGINFPAGVLNPAAATDRFNVSNWDVSATVNTNKYISFTLAPDAGYAIDFNSFVFTSQSSGSGPTSIVVRSSTDGYVANIGSPAVTGGTISLTGGAYQNITSPITFRVYGAGATNTGGTFSINDFQFVGNLKLLCPVAVAIEFVTQPTDVAQDAVMAPVLVRAKCADGTTAAGYTGIVTVAVATGCGYITQSVSAVGGIATFNNIVFTRSAQSGVQLRAFAAGFSNVTSNSFNVTAPGGAPVTTTIASENFEAGTTWSYASGTPTYAGTGTGSDIVTVKTLSGNKTLVKSFSVDNAVSGTNSRKSTNTITFANQTIAATYDYAVVTFKVGSLGDPSSPNGNNGAGVDNGDDLVIEMSLDGGSVWSKTFTYKGNSDYLVPLSAAPVTSLAYNANATYNKPDANSAFSVTLPTGSTQFRLRMTATNNRINENWAIDDLLLVGYTIGSGVTSPLPVVTNNIIQSCPSSNSTISVVTANTQGVVTYVWSPSTNLSSTNISNPVANPPGAQVYTATVTDADGCVATGTVSVTMPAGATGTWTGADNTDWFQCANWGGGMIPTSATNITIPAAALNIAEIDPLSTFATAFGGVASANNIVIDNKILRTQTNAILNVNGSLTIQNSGTLDMTNGGQVNLNGAWSKTTGGIFTAGIGTINYTGTAAQIIAPENYYNLTSSSTGNRTMSAGIVGVAGTFTKGTNTYAFSGGNIVDYNGNGAQSIAAFTAGTSTGATYDNLTLSNTGTKSLSGNTDVEGDLTLNNTIQLAVGGNYLTLKSTATKTARVAPVSAASSISYGTGRFVIERYFPGKRAWRLITAPVTVDATKTFFNSWQAGGNNSLSNGNNGTFITGPNESAANGLDVSPQHNFSLKTFNQLTSGFDGIGNTKAVTSLISGTSGAAGLPDNVGYFMFVRGDRTSNNPQPFNPSVIGNATTLRDTGRIQTQNYTFNCNPSSGTHKYTLIGNPYASPVDFASLTRNNVANKFWAWDPNLNGTNGVGGYAIVDLSLNNVTTVPAGGSTTQNQFIQSKQAFLVETTGGSPTISFAEAAKSANNNLNVFRPTATTIPSLIANLYVVSQDGQKSLSDGVLAQYREDFSISQDVLDAVKFTNVNETFSIRNGTNYFMLERRPFVNATDTIFFSLNRTRQQKYRFNFILDDIIKAKDRIAYLEDRYLKTATPLNMKGSSWVDFEVNSTSASAAPNRFFITFKKVARFTQIRAENAGSDVAVKWTVENADMVDRYEVERSANGVDFVKVGEKQVLANADRPGLLDCIDNDVAPGVYYYRVKAVSTNYKAEEYSETVMVKVIRNKGVMYVYPNPVTSNVIGLKMNMQMPEGLYTIRLLGANGQALITKQLQHSRATATELISYPSSVGDGTYQLEVTGPDKNKSFITIVIFKQ